ncbi:MAG: S8 family serine peptidase [Candidatus Heimdallarchaeota archaeon]
MLKNGTIEKYNFESLIKSKGEFIDIELSDPCSDDFLYDNTVYDEQMFYYMGLNQIQRDLKNDISGYNPIGVRVAIIDNLIDFNHPNLQRFYIDSSGNVEWTDAVTEVVLINDQNEPGEEYEIYYSNELTFMDPYSNTEEYFNDDYSLRDFIDSSAWGHGTSVAGIVNQVAPGAEIISVAIPNIINSDELYYVLSNLLTFLEMERSNLRIKIINNSNRWGFGSIELTQPQREVIEGRIKNLLISENNKLFWVNSAGNKEDDENNNWNIIYPSHLSDNWEADFADIFKDDEIDAEIAGKEDYNSNTAIATGFISVSSIYDTDYLTGLRSNYYVFDNDMDNTGDLKLMAPGFGIRTLTNFLEDDFINEHESGQGWFSGTSAAAPIVAGVAALLCGADVNLRGYMIEKKLTENAIYDSNVNVGSPERLQKYGHGMINPLVTLSSYDSYLTDIDSDGDGLKDIDELYLYHTNVNLEDSDNDGWSDSYELDIETNPTNADSDNDLIKDKTEYDWWIDIGVDSEDALNYIKIKDVDNDLLSDGYEKLMDYDPLDNDMDNDGLLDGLEELTQYNYNTDPEDSDSDNDGYNDLYEINNDTDPNDPNDYPGSGGWGWG